MTAEEILKPCHIICNYNGRRCISLTDAIDAINIAFGNKVPMPPTPMLESILADVSYRTRIPVHKIQSKSRQRELVNARHIYFFRARMLTKLSSIEIGKFVNRDHASTLHGIKQVENIHELREYYQELYEGRIPKSKLIAAKELVNQPIENKALLIGKYPTKETKVVKMESQYSNIPAANNQPFHGYREHQM